MPTVPGEFLAYVGNDYVVAVYVAGLALVFGVGFLIGRHG